MDSLFNLHLSATGLDKTTDKVRMTVLSLSFGNEGARIYASLCPDGTTFAEARNRLNARFGERKSHIYARAKFHTRIHQSGEDVAFYVTELRTLIVPCNYNAAFED